MAKKTDAASGKGELPEGPILLEEDAVGTQTIDVTQLFPRDVTESGSFDFRELRATSLARLLQSLPIPACLVDESERIILRNAEFRAVDKETGGDSDLHFADVFPNEWLSLKALESLKDVFQDRKARAGEAILQFEDAQAWGRLHLRPVRLGGRRVVLALFEDLTLEKKQIMLKEQHESELRQARDDLEIRVQERTAELSRINEQLRGEIELREKTEQDLRASEERYRAVVEEQTELVCRFSSDGAISFVNRSVASAFGDSATDLKGTSFFELIPDEDRKAVAEHLASLSADKAVSTLDHGFLTADGDKRRVQWTYRAILDDVRDVTEFQAVGRDITEQRIAEEHLRESEEKYRLLIQTLPHAVVIIQDRRIIFVNPAGLAMLGFKDAGDATGRDLSETVIDEERPGLKKYMADRIKGDEDSPEHFSTILRSTGGKEFPGEIFVKPITYRGRPAQQVVIFDITERKRAEEQLKNSRETIAALLNATSDLAILLDAEGRLLAYNDKFAKELHEDNDSLLGMNVFDFFPKSTQDKRRRRFREVVENCRPLRFEDETKSRVFDTNVYPVFGLDGNCEGVAVFIRDITESKLAQRRLAESEERYRTIFENAPVSIWEQDLSKVKAAVDTLKSADVTDFRKYFEEHAEFVEHALRTVEVLDVNRATIRLVGARDKSDLLGKPANGFLIESTETFREELVAIAEGKTYFERESTGKTVAGETISYLTSLSIPSETSAFKHTLVSKMDITALKEAQEALLQAKQEWEETFHAVPDLIAIIDSDHRIVRANKAMAERFDFGIEEIRGKKCYEVFHNSDKPSHFCPHMLTADDGQEHVAEFYEEKVGRTFLVSATPLTDEQGRVTGCVHVARDITKRKELEQELRFQATHDPLTKLYNRRHFMEMLGDACAAAERYEYPLSLAIVDLDGFKAVNDTYGHQRGDAVLESFAGILRSELRAPDVVGRYGGDEFIAAFPHTDAHKAAATMDRVRKRLEETAADSTDPDRTISCTAGVADYEGRGMSPEDLIRKADVALYEAKAKGRRQVGVSAASG
jgi:diguanylate cyclase (GGDEF)-like protein/PAS domain S-box-containing protein